ncbi:MAG: S8 family serine peptidase [Anaerolineales bacterium]
MRVRIGLLCVIFVFVSSGCRHLATTTPYATEDFQSEFHIIDRHPPANQWHQGKLSWLPGFSLDTENPMMMDLRSADVSGLNLTGEWSVLQYAAFDSNTIWPTEDRMPPEFDKDLIMELGKNPGLGVRSLHARGITGQGVGIAILDQTLLIEHVEYADRIQLYEEINYEPEFPAAMHGPAVTSLAVGKNTGTAPGASVYYIAVNVTDPSSMPSDMKRNFQYLAQGVRRIIEINRLLPASQKIRVISTSIGWNPEEIGYEDITAAVEEANEEGILVISGRMYLTYDYRLYWLGRYPYDDPDSFDSYGLCVLCAEVTPDDPALENSLLSPMDSRTVAGFTGVEDYAYFSVGGGSWTMPYLAGVYALAVQVDPSITPDDFLELAVETGRVLEITRGDESFILGTIIDPVALIEVLIK